MMTTILTNGQYLDLLSTQNRGLAYGDGLFETIKIRCSNLLCLDHHLERLEQSCSRIRLFFPAEKLKQDIDLLREHGKLTHTDAVLKIVLIRGGAARGYRAESIEEVQRIISVLPARFPPDGCVSLRVCETPASLNPVLAGLKHLNRLDSVLARQEWSDSSIFDGILCDVDGNLVETTMANLFWLRDGTLYTPELTRCGVAGIIRQIILKYVVPSLALPTVVGFYDLAELERADATFICNSIIGVVGVEAIAGTDWSPRDRTIHTIIQTKLINEGYV